jgi:hypothetical protein
VANETAPPYKRAAPVAYRGMMLCPSKKMVCSLECSGAFFATYIHTRWLDADDAGATRMHACALGRRGRWRRAAHFSSSMAAERSVPL